MAFSLFGGGGFSLLGGQSGSNYGASQPSSMSPQQIAALMLALQQANLKQPTKPKNHFGWIGRHIPNIISKTALEIADVAAQTPHAIVDTAVSLGHNPQYLLDVFEGRLPGLNNQTGQALIQGDLGPIRKSPLGQLAEQTAVGTARDFRHPLRHPGYTLLDILGWGGGIAGGLSRGASAAKAVRALGAADRGSLLDASAEVPKAWPTPTYQPQIQPFPSPSFRGPHEFGRGITAAQAARNERLLPGEQAQLFQPHELVDPGQQAQLFHPDTLMPTNASVRPIIKDIEQMSPDAHPFPGQTEIGQELFARGLPKLQEIARTYGMPFANKEDLAAVVAKREEMLQGGQQFRVRGRYHVAGDNGVSQIIHAPSYEDALAEAERRGISNPQVAVETFSAPETYRPQISPNQELVTRAKGRAYPYTNADFVAGPEGVSAVERPPVTPSFQPGFTKRIEIPEDLTGAPSTSEAALRDRALNREPQIKGQLQMPVETTGFASKRSLMSGRFHKKGVKSQIGSLATSLEDFTKRQIADAAEREVRGGAPVPTSSSSRELIARTPEVAKAAEAASATERAARSGPTVTPEFGPRPSYSNLTGSIRVGHRVTDLKPEGEIGPSYTKSFVDKTARMPFELRTNIKALSQRGKVLAESQRLKKQLVQMHGKRAMLEREGLIQQAVAVSAQIRKVERSQTKLRAARARIKPYTVHEVAEGRRAGGPLGAYAEPAGAIGQISKLNKGREPLTSAEVKAAPKPAEVRAAATGKAPEYVRTTPKYVPKTLAEHDRATMGRIYENSGLATTSERTAEGLLTKVVGTDASVLQKGTKFHIVRNGVTDPTEYGAMWMAADAAKTEASAAGAVVRSVSESVDKRVAKPQPEEPKTPQQAADKVAQDLEQRIAKDDAKRGTAKNSPKGYDTVGRVQADLAWAKSGRGNADDIPMLEEALKQARAAETAQPGLESVLPEKPRPETGRGSSSLLAEKIGARDLGVNPRQLEKLGMTKEQANELSRRIHSKMVAVFRKARAQGREPTNKEIYQAIVKDTGKEFADKIVERALAVRGGARIPGHTVTTTAVKAFFAERKARTRRIYYAKHAEGKMVPLKSVAKESPTDSGFHLVRDRLAREEAIMVGHIDVPLSRSPWVAAWQEHIQIPLLERFPEAYTPMGLARSTVTMRRSFEKKVKFDVQEVERIVDALKALEAKTAPAEEAATLFPMTEAEQAKLMQMTEAERSARIGEYVDTMNQVAKFGVLFMKPSYIPANMLGQIFLSTVDHGWNPVDLIDTVSIQRQLFRNGELAGKRAQTIRAGMYDSGIRESAYFERGGLVKPVNDLYMWTADQFGKILDTPFRDAAFIKEAKRFGYDDADKIGHLLDNAMPGQKLHDEFIQITRRANRNIIDYSRMSRVEKTFVRRVIFFYPWFKGATIYGGRFVAEHPLQTAFLTQGGKKAIDENKRELGPLPSYMQGVFKLGSRKIPGLGRIPLIVNPTSATVLGTPGEAINAAVTGVTGSGPGESLGDYVTPAVSTAFAAGFHIDPFTGKDYPAGEGSLDIIMHELAKTPAPLRLRSNLKAAAAMKKNPALAERKLLPMNRKETWERFLTGVSPYALNIKEARSRAFAERTASLPKGQRVLAAALQQRTQWTAELKRVGMIEPSAKGLPPELKQAFVNRAQRDAELANIISQRGGTEGRQPGQVFAIDRLEADMRVLVRRKIIDEASARQILLQMAGASDNTISNLRRKFGGYFGTDIIGIYRRQAELRGAKLTGS